MLYPTITEQYLIINASKLFVHTITTNKKACLQLKLYTVNHGVVLTDCTKGQHDSSGQNLRFCISITNTGLLALFVRPIRNNNRLAY